MGRYNPLVGAGADSQKGPEEELHRRGLSARPKSWDYKEAPPDQVRASSLGYKCGKARGAVKSPGASCVLCWGQGGVSAPRQDAPS
jgi:hypothetical protein